MTWRAATHLNVLLLILPGTIWQGGCSSPPKAAPAPAAQAGMGMPSQPLNTPAGMTQTIDMVAGVLPLGVVPFDNMALPLVSPCGRFVATQTGAPPTWSAALADARGDVPHATRVEIYGLDRRDNIQPQERRAPTLLHSVDEPVLLGSSCDGDGFLIESPRDDGARWIGKVEWQNGEIKWLVNDGSVNAFASLGAGGRLAWSRRAVDAEHFELVVRTGSREWSSALDAGDWLFPAWTGRGDNLFIMRLAAQQLDLCYANASSEAAFRQSMQHLALASEASVHTAYQTIIGQPNVFDGALMSRDQLVFFHPALQRMALWRPHAATDRQRLHLNARSVAALVDQEDFAFVTTPKHLIRQSLRSSEQRIEIVAGTQVVRPCNSAAWPYVLLSPGEGYVGIMAMRLLPREESIFGVRQAAK